MDATTPAIETRGLGKVYRSGFLRRPFTGLERLDLRVERNEVFGFIGPNGAGKTTTLKILVGLQAATSGEARLLGRDHRDPEARRHLGFLPERPYFYQHLTALEFLDFYAQLFDIPAAERRRRCHALLERVGLDGFKDAPLLSFSKGMLQRAGIAQALVNAPALVILDEPMSGLDPLGRLLVRDIILEQRRLGRTVFFSSHILSDVQSVCDRVGLLVQGRMRAVGRVEDLLDHQVRHVDVTVRVAADLAIEGEEITRQGDERVVRVDPSAVERVLGHVLASGGRVETVTPTRADLESLLVEEVKRNQAPRDPGRQP